MTAKEPDRDQGKSARPPRAKAFLQGAQQFPEPAVKTRAEATSACGSQRAGQAATALATP